MRRLGQGNAEKVADCGALQRRRGEAPKAALRLSSTFAGDNGQRANPHAAASAKITATAEPHATARRMLLTPSSAVAKNRARRQGLNAGKELEAKTRRKLAEDKSAPEAKAR